MWGLLGALLVTGIIIISLLTFGQILYKKYPKVAYVIWGIALLFLISLIYTQNTKNTSLGDKNMEQFVGTYKIDVFNSFYDSVDLSKYCDLLLIVNNDHTFHFSKASPFFDDVTGNWQHMDDGDISWTEISIGKQDISQAEVEPDKWLFTGRQLANGTDKNKILFLRQ